MAKGAEHGPYDAVSARLIPLFIVVVCAHFAGRVDMTNGVDDIKRRAAPTAVSRSVESSNC